MAFEDTIKEPWFIAVVAGVGALILILIVIIIILCCLWFRRKKRDDEYEKNNYHHDAESSSSPSSYQDVTETQNWMMVQQNGVSSAPASSETTRHIKGDEPYIAGSSLIKMNEEMRKNGGPASQTRIETRGQSYYKSSVEKSLEENRNVDAFERKISNNSVASRGGYVSGYRGASANSSGRFERTESVRSNQSYQKPRLANIQVSQSARSESFKNDRVYLPERSQPYRIPEEDYSGIEMYSDEERYSWRTQGQSHANSIQDHASLHRLSDGKVKNLTEKFETPEISTANNSAVASRSEVENELKEQLAERRAAVPMSPRRTSREFQQDYSNPSVNWQGRSGKHTIETRVSRYKKAGAVSVFPD